MILRSVAMVSSVFLKLVGRCSVNFDLLSKNILNVFKVSLAQPYFDEKLRAGD